MADDPLLYPPMTLADIKDAIETLALAQMRLSIAISTLHAGLLNKEVLDLDVKTKESNDRAFDLSAGVLDKFMKLKDR